MNLNLSFCIFEISYIGQTSDDGRVSDNVNTLENLMRTGTEFISEISAATIFTSFDFLVKGRCMCIVYVLYCLDPLSRYPVISPPRNHHATNQLAAK